MSAGYRVKRRELLRGKVAPQDGSQSELAATDDQQLQFVNYR
jgi:hypothetical protein